MATQNNEVKELKEELSSTSQTVVRLQDRTQRLLDDVHELKQAVKDLYTFVKEQDKG